MSRARRRASGVNVSFTYAWPSASPSMEFAAWMQRFQRGCCSFTPESARWKRQLVVVGVRVAPLDPRERGPGERGLERQDALGLGVGHGGRVAEESEGA